MNARRAEVCAEARTRRAHRKPKHKPWMNRSILAVTLAMNFWGTAEALEIEEVGSASVPIDREEMIKGAEVIRAPNSAALREAVRKAKRQAVISAIESVLGPNTSHETKVASQIDSIFSQLPAEQFRREEWTRTNKTYDVTIKLVLVDSQFRKLLSNHGLVVGPTRYYSILVMMDEFRTSLRDIRAPMEELEQFKHSQSSANSSDRLASYQPRGVSPEKTSQTYNALVGQLQAYDLRILDNSVFRSKYFKSKPLTIEQMQDGASLAKYVAYAKAEAKADFFMVANSIIIATGKNTHTGDDQCNGIVTIKTYSTVDSESIASETFTEEAAGSNSSDCAAMAAKKLANIGGPIIGARIQDYWKRRTTYGREYVVMLSGNNLSQRLKIAFTSALKTTLGVEGYIQRASGPTQLQCIVNYKGSESLEQALAKSLLSNRDFSKLDSRTDGNQILLCIGSCRGVKRAAREKAQ